jgi:hypothetical protein
LFASVCTELSLSAHVLHCPHEFEYAFCPSPIGMPFTGNALLLSQCRHCLSRARLTICSARYIQPETAFIHVLQFQYAAFVNNREQRGTSFSCFLKASNGSTEPDVCPRGIPINTAVISIPSAYTLNTARLMLIIL